MSDQWPSAWAPTAIMNSKDKNFMTESIIAIKTCAEKTVIRRLQDNMQLISLTRGSVDAYNATIARGSRSYR